MIPIPLFAVAVFLLFTLALLRAGLRGRRIDDHPLCRRCGFDLTGRNPESTRCPECGADLAGRRSIRIGHRKRKGALIGLSLLLLLGCSAYLTWYGWLVLGKRNVNSFKPVWYLLREVDESDPKAQTAAMGELLARQATGRLSDRQIASVVDHALNRQADKSKAWYPLLGDFVELSHQAGKVTDERWTRYLRQATEPKLLVRPRVRRGNDFVVRVDYAARAGRSTALFRHIDSRQITIGGQRMWTQHASRAPLYHAPHDYLVPGGAWAEKLPTGPTTITVEFDVLIHPSYEVRKPLVRTPHRLSAQCLLVEDETTPLIIDEARRDAVMRALQVNGVSVTPSEDPRIVMHVFNPPLGFSFDVFGRIEGRTVQMGSLVCAAGTKGNYSIVGTWPVGNAEMMDVILRPNAELAQRTLDTFEIWGREIVYRDVPLARWPRKAPAILPEFPDVRRRSSVTATRTSTGRD